MPKQSVPGQNAEYYLISYDAEGRERTDDPEGVGGALSASIVKALQTSPITDVFLLSHGWKGDVPAAIDQYEKWYGAMLGLPDRARAAQVRPGFRPLFIGFHWPSQPFGNEDQPSGSFDVSSGLAREAWIDRAAQGLADTPAARAALGRILDAALDELMPDTLSDEVLEAYATLIAEAGLEAGGLGAAPGDDALGWDVELLYQDLLEADEVGFGGGLTGGVLAPIRALSFWKMKKRARIVGEAGGAALLASVLDAAPAARVHLMGHSFGCVVTTSAVQAAAATTARRPSTLFLVQGALSLWSFTDAIPEAPGKPGYFHRVVRDGLVDGPILTTRSVHDQAVRVLYPMAAGVAGQVDMAAGALPKYGGVGTFGARGGGFTHVEEDLRDATASYALTPGTVYNLEAAKVIKDGGPPSGAHSDIAKPEVWHAFWEAVLR